MFGGKLGSRFVCPGLLVGGSFGALERGRECRRSDRVTGDRGVPAPLPGRGWCGTFYRWFAALHHRLPSVAPPGRRTRRGVLAVAEGESKDAAFCRESPRLIEPRYILLDRSCGARGDGRTSEGDIPVLHGSRAACQKRQRAAAVQGAAGRVALPSLSLHASQRWHRRKTSAPARAPMKSAVKSAGSFPLRPGTWLW